MSGGGGSEGWSKGTRNVCRVMFASSTKLTAGKRQPAISVVARIKIEPVYEKELPQSVISHAHRGKEGRREGEGGREGGREKERGREGGREGGKEREGRRGREGEGGREGDPPHIHHRSPGQSLVHQSLGHSPSL